MRNALLLLVLSLMLASCAAGPESRFTNPRVVAIDQEKIEVELTVQTGTQQRIASRTYRYTRAQDGSLHLHGSSNDAAYVFSILRYDWQWSGDTITRRDPGTGELVTCTPEHSYTNTPRH